MREGDGRWKEYVGGYSDWVAQRPQENRGRDTGTTLSPGLVVPSTRSQSLRVDGSQARGKLSFKERRELSGLPAELEELEREQHVLTERMSAPDYYKPLRPVGWGDQLTRRKSQRPPE